MQIIMEDKKIKLLYITHKWLDNHYGGRQNLSKININCIEDIEEIYEKNYLYLEIDKISIIKKIINLKNLYIDGVTKEKIEEIKTKIEKNKINTVFVDGSTIGIINKIVKKLDNKIKVITFFHHKEKKLFYEFVKEDKTVKSLILYIMVYINEKYAEKYSDYCIFLNKRDSKEFKNKHEIFPMVVNGNKMIEKINKPDNILNKRKDRYLLFVGGGGLIGNKKGIIWFIENVLNKVNYKLTVVGTEYDDIKNIYSNVNFMGKVEDLKELYMDSEAVIAPIFLGSGMKTKVAEAASYGKVTFGTEEAFQGYENYDKIGILCFQPDDFIKKLNEEEYQKFDKQKIIKIYQENYSIESQRNRFKRFFLNLRATIN
jgi:hypothetical protein